MCTFLKYSILILLYFFTRILLSFLLWWFNTFDLIILITIFTCMFKDKFIHCKLCKFWIHWFHLTNFITTCAITFMGNWAALRLTMGTSKRITFNAFIYRFYRDAFAKETHECLKDFKLFTLNYSFIVYINDRRWHFVYNILNLFVLDNRFFVLLRRLLQHHLRFHQCSRRLCRRHQTF